jgi:hypothetical protein
MHTLWDHRRLPLHSPRQHQLRNRNILYSRPALEERTLRYCRHFETASIFRNNPDSLVTVPLDQVRLLEVRMGFKTHAQRDRCDRAQGSSQPGALQNLRCPIVFVRLVRTSCSLANEASRMEMPSSRTVLFLVGSMQQANAQDRNPGSRRQDLKAVFSSAGLASASRLAAVQSFYVIHIELRGKPEAQKQSEDSHETKWGHGCRFRGTYYFAYKYTLEQNKARSNNTTRLV